MYIKKRHYRSTVTIVRTIIMRRSAGTSNAHAAETRTTGGMLACLLVCLFVVVKWMSEAIFVLSKHHLWRHVLGCATDCVGPLPGTNVLRAAEVNQFYLPSCIQYDIAQLEVAKHNAARLVQVLERKDQLSVIEPRLERKPSGTVVSQLSDGLKILSFDWY